jgi:hypothetical protein
LRIFVMGDFYPAEARRAADDPFRRRNVPAHLLTALPPKFSAVIDLMIYGTTEAVTIEGVTIAAGMPLTLRQAARQLGVRLRAARAVSDTALFQAAFSRALLSLRRSEGPKNLHTAILIRDDQGDGSAATKTVRLKAIDSIEGKSSSGTHVQVNVAQQTNLTPGYVIRLPATVAPVIDSGANEQD